jgi:hypothetical protein
MPRRTKGKLIRSVYRTNRRRCTCVRAPGKLRRYGRISPLHNYYSVLILTSEDSILTIQAAPPPPINFVDVRGNEYHYGYLAQPDRSINFEEGKSSAKFPPLSLTLLQTIFSHHVCRLYYSSTHPRTRSFWQNGQCRQYPRKDQGQGCL